MTKKTIHNVKISVFADYTEGVKTIKEALKDFFPNIDIGNEKGDLKVQEEQVQSDKMNENDITILSIYAKKQRHLKDFLQNLRKNLSQKDKKTLIKEAKLRLDFKNKFFLRIDKTELIKNQIYKLTNKGNCFHIKMNIATFPNTKENAIKELRDMLE